MLFRWYRPVNKTAPELEEEVRERLEENLREDPEDGTTRVFSSLLGLQDFHETFFENLSLSTLRSVINRWKRDKLVLLLRPEGKDHCRCPVCEGIQNQEEEATQTWKRGREGKDAKSLWKKVLELRAAREKHQEENCLQRKGMYRIRDQALYQPRTGMFHLDAKSQYKYPRFWREVRGVPGCRYSAQAIGLHFLILSAERRPNIISFEGFHDMKSNHSTTFLLEEDAGNQDTDLIGSLLHLFLKQTRILGTIDDLILVLDNCS
jgi:hypothetical protein